MYSVTKSFVAIAIGFLEQEGKLSLQDKIVKFFPDDVPEDVINNVKEQTVEDMLMMSTGFIHHRGNWFNRRKDNRLKDYFEQSTKEPDIAGGEFSKIPGSFFVYDSWGSFVLGTLVERLTNKSLMEFLREKLFDKIGVSAGAKMLKCPGGHSWSDSALICTPMDLLKSAKFVMDYGKVNGEQLLSEEFLKKATSKQIDNSINGNLDESSFGYGYKFWRTWNNSFFFNGMGCQFAVCVPDKDMILIYDGDNQGNEMAKVVIIDRFFEEIVDTAKDISLGDEEDAEKELSEYCKDLKLQFARGEKTSSVAEKVNGQVFKMNENSMGITKMQFNFKDDEGTLVYTNAQGEKELKFGILKNVFCDFPQEGYSDEIGSQKAVGHYYKCASSAAWVEDTKLGIMVQIIDEYFGRMFMSVSFKKENEIAVLCTKAAEDFLDEYDGYADGIAIK